MSGLRSKSEGGGGKVALLTYAHAEPFHVGLMDIAETALAAEGFGPGDGYEHRRWFGNRDRNLTRTHAGQALEWAPDVVLSFMTNADLALLEATAGTGVPIVCWSMDPVGGGLVRNMACPEGNLTGVTFAEPIQVKQLDILLRLRPQTRHVAMLHNPTYAIAPAALRHLETAAAGLGVLVTPYECLSADEIGSAFVRMRADGIGAAVVGPHEIFNGNGRLVADAAAVSGIVAVGLQSTVENGGPAGFGIDFAQVWAKGAAMAGRILRGVPVSQLPFDSCVSPLLLLNSAGLARIGVEPSPEVLALAHRVLAG